VTWAYRLKELAARTSPALLAACLIMAFLALVAGSSPISLRSLELIEEYQGPPAVIAAATDHGLVVLRLAKGSPAQVVQHYGTITRPRNLQLAPDGQWFAVQQGGTLHILETRSQGAHVQVAVQETADWSWSPDGQSLAYTDGSGRLAVFDVASQDNRLLVPAAEAAWGMPIWASDGSQIAYASADPLPTASGSRRRQGIWRVTPASGYRIELARNPVPGETLLVPAAWAADDSVLLAWDMGARAVGNFPTLYRITAAAHRIESIEGASPVLGTRLAWPVSIQGTTFIVRDNHLIALHLADQAPQPISDQIPWPSALAWSPNGAWAANVVAGAAEGQGLYLLAPQKGTLRPVELPDGAAERAVFWAGAEYLFVLRQPTNSSVVELWLVSLASGNPPRRVLTNVRLPDTGPYSGWRWQDVLAAQVISAPD
jgi:hypothetical protein